jgi:hypothetical protein
VCFSGGRLRLRRLCPHRHLLHVVSFGSEPYRSLKPDLSPNIMKQSDIDDVKAGRVKVYVFGYRLPG